jgi:hypothetical protein
VTGADVDDFDLTSVWKERSTGSFRCYFQVWSNR